MILLLHKRQILSSALFLILLGGMTAILWKGGRQTAQVFFATGGEAPVVVIDAGHGGVDGGAVAADGTVESGINLEIARRVDALMRFTGQKTQMTRTEDISIYSEGSDSIREKKVSDLHNRVALVNGMSCAVLISIHQNSLPSSPSVHGAQVFYNAAAGGDVVAKSIQASLNDSVNRDNPKTAKQGGANIYLLKETTAPAVIVECGFLSNRGETDLLKDPSYQLKLAVSVTAGYLAADPAREEHS